MNQEVADYMLNLPKWQAELAEVLRNMVHETIPEAEERIQYKKPHFLKNGHYAAVISPSKDAVAFMIMNAAGIDFPKGFDGPAERKWIKLKEGGTPDLAALSELLKQASGTL
ncbi:hypothetical protein SAMN02799624_01750 [Paenibacillus sp. UNC496MF]|uniref:DUF1801 domain-containing protein n=1 Tax=Paenibacillus sp. UNC496MF TaxID=1502753 RepID=UPI0008E9E72D|nr:DUF1801 domain-containing protein [Paenibacillus sp. UNC496MF]SFI69347.1 hypothetical protein SAMN02799624_01750 [Paenibacillus sp. UNC496MF]